ncbi:hypothetical protein B0H13DRAFT_2009505 [Mycena leptocephala]|nr:hypothetical protein B0H13DRAFT_2009505 [Mycena leptocephala]
MQLMRDNLTMIPDDWDVDKTNFLNSPEVLNGFEKRRRFENRRRWFHRDHHLSPTGFRRR